MQIQCLKLTLALFGNGKSVLLKCKLRQTPSFDVFPRRFKGPQGATAAHSNTVPPETQPLETLGFRSTV